MIQPKLFHLSTVTLLVGVISGFSSLALAEKTAKQFVETNCAGCHALSEPESFTTTRIRERKAPDLYYAGNKFQEDWLIQWLQSPTRIRPGGTFFGQNVVAAEDRDIVPKDKLPEHPAFNASEAEVAASYLMSLTPYDELISSTAYVPKPISGAMGRMNFTKFKGCVACHELEKGYGGISGPEVHTAGSRLKPEFLYSFIKNPQAWAPKTFMSNLHLDDSEVQKLSDFITTLSKE